MWRIRSARRDAPLIRLGIEPVARLVGDALRPPAGLGERLLVGFQLGVGLTVDLPGVPDEAAEKLVKTAHNVCPYSNATRGNITVDVRIASAPLPQAELSAARTPAPATP